MQQNCSITGNVPGTSETGGPHISTGLEPAQSVSAPLTAAVTPRQGERNSGLNKVHGRNQSAFGASRKQAADRGRHAAACKKTGTEALIEKRGLPFAFHHEHAGHPAVFRNQRCDPDMPCGGGFGPSQHVLPSHSCVQRSLRQLSSDESLAPVPVYASSEALPPPRPAETGMPAARHPDWRAQPGTPSRPEWDATPATDIPALPSRPKSAFPRSTPPPRVSISRSTPPVQRRGSPARTRQPHSPGNATRARPSQPSHVHNL